MLAYPRSQQESGEKCKSRIGVAPIFMQAYCATPCYGDVLRLACADWGGPPDAIENEPLDRQRTDGRQRVRAGKISLYFAAILQAPSCWRRIFVRRTATCMGRPVRASTKSSVRV